MIPVLPPPRDRRGGVEFRRGSGVYVRTRGGKPAPGGLESLDNEIANLLRSARERGTPLAAVGARIRHWLELQPPDRFLITESDPELRRILAAELREAATLPVTDAGPEAAESLELDLRSVSGSLQLWTPIPRDALIAVASRWPDFLKWARTMLLATGAAGAGVATVIVLRRRGPELAVPRNTTMEAILERPLAVRKPAARSARP